MGICTPRSDVLSQESSDLLEVYLSSRVSLSNRVPLHYLGIQSGDSLFPEVADTLDRVLTRDLTLCRLFNLRLPSVAVDTTRSHPFQSPITYLEGNLTADSTFQVKVQLSSPYGAQPFWIRSYRFPADKARPVAHRISADVVRQLTGEATAMETRIAFLGQKGGSKEIFSVTFDGFDLKQHTYHGVPLLSPAWSPDGRFIAYTTFLEGQADIYILDLADGSYRSFCSQPGVDQAASWSPDGQWIAYSSSVDGNAEIYIRRLESGETRRLTYSWAIETSPCWSPTGREIAFTSDRLGRPQVFIMDADGANQRRLTVEGDYNDSPAWSPRGDLIAYVRRDVDGFQIYLTDPRGEKHIKITSGPGDNMDPCWSPDGMKIAFTSNRTGRKQVYTMDLFGGEVLRVSDRRMSCSSPTWSPVLKGDSDIVISSEEFHP